MLLILLQGKAQGCISGLCSLANVVSPLAFSPLTGDLKSNSKLSSQIPLETNVDKFLFQLYSSLKEHLLTFLVLVSCASDSLRYGFFYFIFKDISCSSSTCTLTLCMSYHICTE